jgi:prefoldin subunit 5
MRHSNTTRVLSLLACLPMLGGCIVQDIHDELVGVNARLERVEETLGKIDTTNRQLATLEARLNTLDRLESIDASLKSIDAELVAINGELDPIKGSLVNLDEHLTSLRKTISNIDSTIPFLKLSGDADEADGEGGEPEQATPDDGPRSKETPSGTGAGALPAGGG